MSRDFPAQIDAWQMAQGRRSLSGSWPLARLPRLRPMLAADGGEVGFSMAFGIDEIGVSFVDLTLDAALPLTCQRTLEEYQHLVSRTVRLGLLRQEADEAGLPEDYEPLLAPGSETETLALVEDELILAIPLVPKNPNASIAPGYEAAASEQKDNPFAVLKQLKSK